MTNNERMNRFFGNSTVDNANNGGTGTIGVKIKERVATKGQLKYYIDLCNQKEVEVDPNYLSFTSEQCSNKIKKLLALKKVTPPSDKQIELLIKICNRMGINVPKYDHLTGGREGSMSRLITNLLEQEKRLVKVKLLSEEQKKMIEDMLLCPDIPTSWEYILTETLESGEVIIKERKNFDDIPNQYQEFTMKVANKFIQEHKVIFYDWKKTRLTKEQMNFIWTLQERNGEPKFTFPQIIQFSREQASQYIDMLQSDLSNKSLTTFSQEEYIDDDVARNITISKLNEKMRKDFEQMVHNLYASIGQEAETETLLASLPDEFTVEDESFNPISDLIILVNALGISVDSIIEMCSKVIPEKTIDNILGLTMQEA